MDIAAVTKTVAIKGERFPVVDVGTGSVVVFLHGFPDSRYLWRHQIPAFVAAGFRVIAPDLRGFGEAPRPTDVFREWSRGQGDQDRYLRDLARPGEDPLPKLPSWDRIRTPMLGVWSDGDLFLLEPQMALSAGVVDAPWRYERITGAGHWMMLDKPDDLNRLLIDFLGA